MREISNKEKAKYCVKYAEIIDHMPLTPVGKVDYRALELDAQKGM